MVSTTVTVPPSRRPSPRWSPKAVAGATASVTFRVPDSPGLTVISAGLIESRPGWRSATDSRRVCGLLPVLWTASVPATVVPGWVVAGCRVSAVVTGSTPGATWPLSLRVSALSPEAVSVPLTFSVPLALLGIVTEPVKEPSLPLGSGPLPSSVSRSICGAKPSPVSSLRTRSPA